MAIDVATLRASLIADTSKFESSMGRAAKTSNSKLAGIGRGFKSMATVAAGAFAAAGVASAVKSSIDAASDLGEQINKTKVVFRGSEKDILAWSKTTASSLGISRREALEAAGVFGNMLVPMGFARKEAAGMSSKMVTLAADMASFNNASPAETLDALRAGLAGESEPLRRFGVFLNDARLKQEALNMGLYKGKGNLDAAAKASATYSLILKDTKDAQGDFGRTSDSLANKQRIFSATLEDTKAKLGNALLPAATAAMSAFINLARWVDRNRSSFIAVGNAIKSGAVSAFNALKTAVAATINVIRDIINWSNRHKTTAEFLKTTIGLLVAGFAAYRVALIASRAATVALVAATTALNVAMRLTPIGLAVTALAALGAGLIMAWKHSQRFRAIVSGAFRAVAGAATAMVGVMRGAVGAFYNIGKDMILGLVHGIAGMVGAAINAVKNVVGSVIKGARNLLESKSPSKVFMEIGEDVTKGFAIGITRGMTGVLFPIEAEIASLERRKDALAKRFEDSDTFGKMSALRKTAGSKDVKGKDDDARRKAARQELAQMTKELQRARALARIDLQIAGLEKAKTLRDALVGISDTLKGKVKEAVDQFRDAWERVQGSAFDAATDLIIANTDASKELGRLRGLNEAEDIAAEQNRIQAAMERARQENDIEAMANAAQEQMRFDRNQRIKALELQVAAETKAIQEQRLAERKALEDAAVVAFESNLTQQLNAEFAALQARKQGYATFVRDVQAILAPLGLMFDADAGAEAAIGGGKRGGMRRRGGARAANPITGSSVIHAVFNVTTNDSDEAARKVHSMLLNLQRRSGSLGFT